MINSNPETVSTDYDVADKLYFEPLTLEDTLNILEAENVEGVIVQLGGQTPLNLAAALKANGIKIIGSQPEAIALAENRELFANLANELNIRQPENSIVFSESEAIAAVKKIGYPVLIRPSFVLGGRAMEIVYTDSELSKYMRDAVEVSLNQPVLIDKFLDNAIEIDVDCLCDGSDVFIAGIMEHIEQAGIHSGDSACILPAFDISKNILKKIEEHTIAFALKIGVIGLMNVQYAVANDELYIIEVNPRASRTVPFVSKTYGISLANIAAKIMTGAKIKDFGLNSEKLKKLNYYAVKEAVLPFNRFDNVDIILGPEMKSTGEVMGIDTHFGLAFLKSQFAANVKIPYSGGILLTVNDKDKSKIGKIAFEFSSLGYTIFSTPQTAASIKKFGVEVIIVHRKKDFNNEKKEPDEILKMIENGIINLIINTPGGSKNKEDSYRIRRHCILYSIPIITTMRAAEACIAGLLEFNKHSYSVQSIQNRYSNQMF